MDIAAQLTVNSLIAGSLYALVAMSFNLIFGATRFFNLAHGALATVGAYGTFYVGVVLGLPLSVAVAGGVLTAALAGYALERLVFRPLRARKASNLVLLIASLGILIAVEAILAIFFTSQFKTLSVLTGAAQTIHIGSAVITHVQLTMFASAVLVCGTLWLVLSKTSFGRAIRAVSDDAEVAKIVGINTNVIIAALFVIGSAIVGLSGVLYGLDTGIEPRLGFMLLLKGVIAAIVGGIGNVYGGFLGAFLVGFAENFGIWFISGEWKEAIAFGLLVLFLVFRPQGILGKKHT
ncbi:branched-chain amino acid ABC transporter permease [Patescibacteria group bacterium]|nr:branched-chain amino acid ABC transporter permease [Patescibacteria group bacterium]